MMRTFPREKILATAQPIGFTAVSNPLIPDGVTIVSNQFSRFVENGTLPANQFGFVLPKDETEREELDCAEIHHFDANGCYAGGDIYLYDSYLIEEENLGKAKDAKKTFRIYSARFIYEEGRLVERRYGILPEGTPIGKFKYQHIEKVTPENEEEEESVDIDDIVKKVESDGIEAFRISLSTLPETVFIDYFKTVSQAVEDLESEIEGAPGEIADLEEEIKEAEKEKHGTTELIKSKEMIEADAEDKKAELEKLKPIKTVLEREKAKRDKAKKVAERGAVIYERAWVVKATREMERAGREI